MRVRFDDIDRLEQAMTFHRERHAVLAGNVANVDTPGYQPLDLERIDPLAAGPLRTRAFADPDGSVGPDGNAVSLERELAKIDANRVRYGVSSELVSRRFAILRYAASDGG
jgi:flagellar basal-body rod protein FlgB